MAAVAGCVLLAPVCLAMGALVVAGTVAKAAAAGVVYVGVVAPLKAGAAVASAVKAGVKASEEEERPSGEIGDGKIHARDSESVKPAMEQAAEREPVAELQAEAL